MRFYTLISLALTLTICYGACDWFTGELDASRPTPIKSQPVVLHPVPALLKEGSGRPVKVMESKVIGMEEFKNAQFVNAEHGWASSNRSLYKTSDGGKSWERIDLALSSSSYVSSLFFVDEYHGWLVVRSESHSERYGFGNASRIMVSNDGGRSWLEQAAFANEVKITSISFFNRNEGMAIGSKVVGEKPPYDEIFALGTNDGGKEWNDISERIKSVVKNEYGIANDIGRAINSPSPTQTYLLTKFGRVIGSTDLGKSWKTVVQFEDRRPDGSVSSTGYLKIFLDTDGRILVMGGASGEEGYWGDLIVNDDQGLWTSYELIRIPFRDAIFLSDNELVVCGRELKTQQERMQSPLSAVGIILQSVDHGKSWAPIYRSKENETFISLTKVDSNSFYALSDTGTFLRLTLGN